MTSITTNVRENVMLDVYLIQAKKISFVETGKIAEYSIWGARNMYLYDFVSGQSDYTRNFF